ncbi:MAG: caspase family protein [Planctomycetia bacterium]|nr:caspase family protein [Planctomycetia bacterium]
MGQNVAQNIANYALKHNDFYAAAYWQNVALQQDDALGQDDDSKGLGSELHSEASLCKWHAFLVGVSEYDSDSVPKLSFPVSDVRHIKRRLMDMGVPQENITTLYSGSTNAAPKKTEIEEQYQQFLDKLPEDAYVLVYLAGHGYHDATIDYFAPQDMNNESLHRMNNTSLSIQALQKQLHDSNAKFCWFCVDACRTSPIPDAKGLETPTETDPITRAPSFSDKLPDAWLNMCACRENEQSVEVVEYGGGLFTSAILDALLTFDNPADENNDQNVTFGEFQQFVEARTNELARYAGYSQEASCSIYSEIEIGENLKDLIFFTTCKGNSIDNVYRAKDHYIEGIDNQNQGRLTIAKEALDVVINSPQYTVAYKRNAHELLKLIEDWEKN